MSRVRRLTTVALAVLLVVSAGVGSVAAAPAAQEDDEGDDDLPTADDAYVTDGGDVVLVYQNDSADTETEFGLDVSESVFHALVVTNASDTEATGQATAVVDPNGLTADGSLMAPTPSAITSLTFDASGEQTDENAAFDASFEATLNDSSATATGLVTGAQASGQFSVAPDTFTATGQFDADLRTPLGPSQHQAFRLQETSDGYTLDASQNFTVSQFAEDRWSTRQQAAATLDAQYAAVAQSLGGSGEVTIESYSYTSTAEGGRLDVEFTVEYTGVDEGLSQQITASLTNSERYNLTETEAQEVGDAVADITVDDVRVRFDQTPEQVSGEFSASLSNYEPAVRGALTVAGSVEGQDQVQVANQLDRVEQTFEARQEAGLVETVSFDVTLDSPSTEPTTVTASVDYRTENWAAYREALAERGIDTANAEYEFHAETQDDQIVAEGSATIQQDGLLQQTSNTLLNSTNSSDARTRRFIRAFQDAKLRKAKMDVNLAEDELTVEAGAAFEDLASLRDAVRASTDSNLKVAGAVGRTEGDQLHTYVTLDAAVSADATEEDVRALGPVGEETTVHLAGTYNRTFPETDVEGAYEYLGIPRESGSGSGSGATPSDGSGAGFGVGIAAVALLGGALLLARRDE